MIFTIAVQTEQYVEVDAENAEAAIEAVRAKLDPRVAAAARYEVVQEIIHIEETNTYKVKE